MARLLIGSADAVFLTYLRDGLEGDGHFVRAVGSVDDALEEVSETRFDLLIADVFQPVVEGVALFATIARACPRTRLIALTDFTTARARNYEINLWVDSLIAKPFTISRIRSEVDHVLRTPLRRAGSADLSA